jgi:hypothetical protein
MAVEGLTQTFEFGAQLGVIVDFAVINQGKLAVFHGLVAGSR